MIREAVILALKGCGWWWAVATALLAVICAAGWLHDWRHRKRWPQPWPEPRGSADYATAVWVCVMFGALAAVAAACFYGARALEGMRG